MSAARTRSRRVRPVAIVRGSTIGAVRWVARQEVAVLVAALAILLALFGFVKIAEEVHEGDMQEFDGWVLRLFRDPANPEVPIGPAWMVEAATDVTALGSRTLMLVTVLSAAGYLAIEGKYGAMWLVGIAAGGGGMLTVGMKQLFGRARPDVVPHLVEVLSPSFPSGHSMLVAVVYLTLGALLARFAARRRTKTYLLGVAMLLTVVVGLSRVYLGVHYPTDVLAGWCAGLVWALGCWMIARYLQYRGAVEAPPEPPEGR
jgi:undecaprenyl-diphosphatase